MALEYAQQALDYDRYNIVAYQVRATTYRKLNQPKLARRALEQVLEIDPLNHLARFELYLLQPNNKSLKNFQSMIRNELPHENYIEMATYYVRLGLDAEAAKLLKYAPEYPTVYYWLGYLIRNNAPAESQMYLEKARSLSAERVFPFREESIPVFQWAIETCPSDWKAKYYLGLIYWNKKRMQDARESFDDCDESDFAPLFICRGHLYKEVNLKNAEADFEHAVKIDSKSWRTWHYLIDFYNEQGMFEKSLSTSEKAFSILPNESLLQVDMVRSLVNNKRYKQALSLLDTIQILPYEGATAIHHLFVRSHVHLAVENMEQGQYAKAIQHLQDSKEYPERLGTGRPYDADFSLQQRLITVCNEKMAAENEKDRKFQMTDELSRLIEDMDAKRE